jgi:acyl-CoA dehydrogenase
MCTPAGDGADDARWDTWRNCEFAEILGFYGLPYWYTWQVTVLGLGPIWMSDNEAVKERTAAKLLEDGAVFAFGLSEKEHGADLYSSEMTLHATGDGTYRANGSKYYIGNGNEAALVSTFGKMPIPGEYCFFAVDRSTRLRAGQERGAQPELRVRVRLRGLPGHRGRGHPVPRRRGVGRRAQHRQHRQVQPRLGLDRHLHPRLLRGHPPCRPPPPLRHGGHRLPPRPALFTDAYARLVAMKLVALRAADYMRSATPTTGGTCCTTRS